PCYYQAPTSGIYYVAMYGPSGKNSQVSSNNGVEHNIEAINTGENQNTGISAWDVTVRSSQSSISDLLGRLHTFNMAFNMGQNQANLYADLYPITVDGFRYRIELNGLDPFVFNIFGSQLGNLDSDGITPLYRTVVGNNGNINRTLGNTRSALPQYPLFFNEIDDEILPFLQRYDPLSGLQTGIGFPASPILPEVIAPAYIGNLDGNTSTVGGGGVFEFGSNLLSGSYEIVVSRDGIDYDSTNPENKVIRGLLPGPGQQSVSWDGFDNSGVPFPPGGFAYSILIKGGEYHFPMSDVENNPFGGPIYNLLNATNPRGNSVGFYDHRGYYTIDGTLIPDRDTSDGDPLDDALCGLNPPTPPVSDLITGADSAAPGFNVFGTTTGIGNTNVLCTGTFGDTKTLDLWTFFPSVPPLNTLLVINPTDFGDAPERRLTGGLGYQTLVQNNGPAHNIVPKLVYLGEDVSNDNNGFVDGIDDTGNATDDADDAFDGLSAILPGRLYSLSNIPVTNNTNKVATLYAWIDFDQDGAFETAEFQQVLVNPGQSTAALTWEVPSDASIGTTYIRFRLTTDELVDDGGTAEVDERSLGLARDGEVEDYQGEIRGPTNSPTVLLIKRITAVGNNRQLNPNDGTILDQFVDDTVGVQADDDNHPFWPLNYLLGALNGGDVRSVSERPGDSVEYTLYFLSVGEVTARDVLVCDRIPPNTDFISNSYTEGLPAHPLALSGGSPPTNLGLTLHFQGNEYALTAAADTDPGYYFPPGFSPTAVFPQINCNGPNKNGMVVVDIGDLMPAISSGNPLNAWGLLRFQVRVR
ncbi:MAG: DUF11 domain-containing protein, partial [Cyanobacteria bacterium J06621_11]